MFWTTRPLYYIDFEVYLDKSSFDSRGAQCDIQVTVAPFLPISPFIMATKLRAISPPVFYLVTFVLPYGKLEIIYNMFKPVSKPASWYSRQLVRLNNMPIMGSSPKWAVPSYIGLTILLWGDVNFTIEFSRILLMDHRNTKKKQ